MLTWPGYYLLDTAIIGIYCILWASLIASMWAVLELGEYTIFMHIDTVGFMHGKL